MREPVAELKCSRNSFHDFFCLSSCQPFSPIFSFFVEENLTGLTDFYSPRSSHSLYLCPFLLFSLTLTHAMPLFLHFTYFSCTVFLHPFNLSFCEEGETIQNLTMPWCYYPISDAPKVMHKTPPPTHFSNIDKSTADNR